MPLALAVGHELVRALSFAAGMAWEILWALILGFALSGVVQAVGSKRDEPIRLRMASLSSGFFDRFGRSGSCCTSSTNTSRDRPT